MRAYCPGDDDSFLDINAFKRGIILRGARRLRPEIVTVDTFSSDVSIYGVYGLAGNMRDWTATERVEGEKDSAGRLRCTRGGHWAALPVLGRCASRFFTDPWRVTDEYGFRVAMTVPKK